MSATLSKLRTSWVGRALLAYAVSALALVVLGLAAPGSAVFFPLVSLWCNLALFGLVLVVLRLADVKFDLFHWAVIIGFWAAALLYFYWAETRRSFVYIWDYVNYINKQYNAEAAFLQGPAVGFHFILDSLAEDYTNFNTLFLEFPFCLTDRTGDSFAICQVFSIVPMLLLLLAGLVVKVGQMLQVKNRFWYFLIGLSWTFTYPWLRMSAVLSQPDWFGLIFAFSILLLTLDFRFEKLDLPRFGLLFLATAAIILSRRWYLYFVVGYYFAYAVLVLVSSARIAKVGRRQDALLQVRNLILFGLMSMVAMVILLWPLVSHILGYDYADHYSYYNGGGMVTETYLQCARMGLMNLVLMGMGLWFCFKRRKMPALPCLAGLEILLSMVLFTRVQTTGSQHMLLFLPGWFLLFLIGAAALAEGMNRRRNLKIGFWLFTIAFATSVRCSPLTTVALPDFLIGRTLLSASPQESAHDFAAIDDLVYDRKDLPQIQAIAKWIDSHCADGEVTYMIPHDMLYCSDHFKNCFLPETPINSKLSFGFSVPGTHDFPMQFFEAKYVITADPFPQTYVGNGEMSHKLNEQFLAVRDDLGFGLLLKRYTNDVNAATPEMIKQAAADTIPSVTPMFWSFRIMVGSGLAMALVFVLGLFYSFRNEIAEKAWYLRLAVLALPLPWIASEAGWFVAEYGRQPWTIYNVLPTHLSVSALTAGDVAGSLLGFGVLYTALLVVEMWLMIRISRRGPSALGTGRYHFERN